METLDKIIKELSGLSTEQLIRVSDYVEKMKAEADVIKEIGDQFDVVRGD